MLNCLAAAIPGGDRIVSADEVFEFPFSHRDWVPKQTRLAGLQECRFVHTRTRPGLRLLARASAGQ
jgi:Flp pilus assembly CpaF family ATPase